MALDASVIENLTRHQIDAVWAFKFVDRNTSHAAKVLHTSYGAQYNLLATVRDATGLDPYIPEQFDELYNGLENYRKEKMNGRPFDLGEYFYGKRPTP